MFVVNQPTANTSLAFGWNVHRLGPHRWGWSAYGSRGGNTGTAASEADARAAAQRSADDLSRPRTTED